jgi:hypothetical protein
MRWINERVIPTELLELLDSPTTPKDLWREIIRARDEVNNYGAVTYPTKARVEALYLKFVLGQENKDYETKTG